MKVDPRKANKFELFALTFLLSTPTELEQDAIENGEFKTPGNLIDRLKNDYGFSEAVVEYAVNEFFPQMADLQMPFHQVRTALRNQVAFLYDGPGAHPLLSDARRIIEALQALDKKPHEQAHEQVA